MSRLIMDDIKITIGKSSVWLEAKEGHSFVPEVTSCNITVLSNIPPGKSGIAFGSKEFLRKTDAIIKVVC